MVLKAQGGGFKNLAVTVAVPADWPDQQRVRVVKEDLPRCDRHLPADRRRRPANGA